MMSSWRSASIESAESLAGLCYSAGSGVVRLDLGVFNLKFTVPVTQAGRANLRPGPGPCFAAADSAPPPAGTRTPSQSHASESGRLVCLPGSLRFKFKAHLARNIAQGLLPA
jgi:hypothetical protein